MLSALYVDFLSLPISAGVCGRATLGPFDPGSRRGSVGMGTDKGKPVRGPVGSSITQRTVGSAI